jgi:crotonobetainyl-CoA:carnitine CoA-transferase CaiB-like acyl-CoA transferase
MKEIGAELAQLSTAEVSARLTEQGVPHAAVTNIDDLPEVIERISPGYLVRDVHPEVGELLHPRPAVTFDEAVTVRPAPALGEHTDEIRAELA